MTINAVDLSPGRRAVLGLSIAERHAPWPHLPQRLEIAEHRPHEQAGVWQTIASSSNIAASVIRARMSADGEFDLIKTAPITRQQSHIQSAGSQR